MIEERLTQCCVHVATVNARPTRTSARRSARCRRGRPLARTQALDRDRRRRQLPGDGAMTAPGLQRPRPYDELGGDPHAVRPAAAVHLRDGRLLGWLLGPGRAARRSRCSASSATRRARRAGLLRSRCKLGDTRLVLAYLSVARASPPSPHRLGRRSGDRTVDWRCSHARELLGWGPPIDTHSAFVALGMASRRARFLDRSGGAGAGPAHPVSRARRARRRGALSRLGTWLQHLDPTAEPRPRRAVAYGKPQHARRPGRRLARRARREAHRAVPLRTGDLFAPAVALAMAIGRFGCLLTEQPGTPTGRRGASCSTRRRARIRRAPAGVPLHPSFALRDRLPRRPRSRCCGSGCGTGRSPPGRCSRSTSPAYGDVPFPRGVRARQRGRLAGLTRPQLFLLVTIPVLLGRIALITQGAFSRNPERMPSWTDRPARSVTG